MTYDPKTAAALDRLNDQLGTFEPVDFARLALACLDQAGLSLPAQTEVQSITERALSVDLDPQS